MHKNLNRYEGVLAWDTDADLSISLTIDLLDYLKQIPLTEGYSFFASGEYEDQQEASDDLEIILILAQVAIFAVLVL